MGLSLALAGWTPGCEVGPRSGLGLRLPDGDPVRGEAAYRALGCDACHSIHGGSDGRDRPGEPPVVLGGRHDHIETHGELVTSIINPSHGFRRSVPGREELAARPDKMGNFNDQMTVARLIDLTAYLQTKYELDPELIYGP